MLTVLLLRPSDGVRTCVGGAVYLADEPSSLGSATDVVRVFESTGPNSGTWFNVASMLYRRAYHSVAVWRHQVFAVGGENEHKK